MDRTSSACLLRLFCGRVCNKPAIVSCKASWVTNKRVSPCFAYTIPLLLPYLVSSCSSMAIHCVCDTESASRNCLTVNPSDHRYNRASAFIRGSVLIRFSPVQIDFILRFMSSSMAINRAIHSPTACVRTKWPKGVGFSSGASSRVSMAVSTSNTSRSIISPIASRDASSLARVCNASRKARYKAPTSLVISTGSVEYALRSDGNLLNRTAPAFS